MLAVTVKNRLKAESTKATSAKQKQTANRMFAANTHNSPPQLQRIDGKSETNGFWEMSATEALKVCYVDHEHQSKRD